MVSFMLFVLASFCIIALLVFSPAKAEAGCFVVVAGREASATGRVQIGHNEDNRGELIMRHHYIAPATNEEGQLLSFEQGAAEIPQVRSSEGFFWTETLRPQPGESFADSFVNDRGVAVVSNTCCISREDAPELTDGGIGWALRRIVAERAHSAESALEIAADLVLRYGYRASGRSYVFADSREAWVFQTVHGKNFAAARIPDDHVLINPNHYSIRKLDLSDPKNFRASPGLIEYAVRRGWYEPAVAGSFADFDFAAAFQHPDCVRTPMNVARHLFGLAIATGVKSLPGREACLPFSEKPASPLTHERILSTLSCHCEREGEGDWREGPHVSGGVTATGNNCSLYTRICNGATRESVIIDLAEEAERIVIWSCFGNPCILPMTPWIYGAKRIPTAFLGETAPEPLAGHFTAMSEDLIRGASEAWNASRALVEYCDEDYAGRAPALAQNAKAVNDKLLASCRAFVESRGVAEASRSDAFLWAEERSQQVMAAICSFQKE